MRSAHRSPTQAALDEDHRRGTGATPISAIVTRVANISGMSNRLPRAMLMSTPRPRSPPTHSRDDRADHRERDADAHATEDRRQGGRDLDLRRRPASACARKLRAISSSRGSTDRMPDHRRDRDREEHDQRADHELADARPVAEPQDDERRQGEDRRRLRRDEVGRRAAVPRGASGRARRRRRARASPRPRSPSRISTSVVDACGSIVPSAQARTNRCATVHGAGQDERRVARQDTRSAARRATNTTTLATTGTARPSRGGPGRAAVRRRARGVGGRGRVGVAAVAGGCTAPLRLECRADAADSAAISAARAESTSAVGADAAGRRGRRRRSGPGAGDSTSTRSARNTASGMLWVTSTIVVPVRCQRSSSSALNRSRVRASRALNGSSSSRTCGLERERPGDRDPLAHAARQRSTAWRSRPREPRRGPAARRRRARVPRRGQPASSSGKRDVAGRRPPRQQPRLLEHEADALVRTVDRSSVDRDLARVRRQQAGQRPGAGCSCRSRWAR